MKRLGEEQVSWVCRVPETSTEAKSVIEPYSPDWQTSADGQMRWYTRLMELPQGKERWVVVSSTAGEQRAKQTMERKLIREQRKELTAMFPEGVVRIVLPDIAADPGKDVCTDEWASTTQAVTEGDGQMRGEVTSSHIEGGLDVVRPAGTGAASGPANGTPDTAR